jgi:hypothetical protein
VVKARRGGRSKQRTGCFIPRGDLIPIVQEARWTSTSVLKSAENLAPTGVRIPDRPAGRELKILVTI